MSVPGQVSDDQAVARVTTGELVASAIYHRERSLRHRVRFEELVAELRRRGKSNVWIARQIGWTEGGVRLLAKRRGWDDGQDQKR